jgi:lipoprotein-anchoring transpeptidase ErfK/SrfK
LPDRRRADGGVFFFRLLVVLVLLIAAWVWWRSQRPAVTLPPPAPAGPATHRVMPPTPVSAPAPASAGVPAGAAVAPPPPVPVFPRPARDVLEAQVALARMGISPGLIDGLMGPQTHAAILAFQRKLGLSETLELDDDTRPRLVLETPPLTRYTITSNDLARLRPVSHSWLGKSQQAALDYETILELVAEKGHASQNLVRRLNPAVEWTNVPPGTEVQIPEVTLPKPNERAGFILISLGEKKLEVFDAATNLLAHFPCSIAARVEKRPAGELRVAALAPNPDYTFDPEVFPESAEARQLNRKLILPPGPNNPVGTAWISLDKPGYGIHGTPNPEQVGRTESHGCFRLANWNAEHLLKLAWVGMPVYVEP